MEEVGALKYSVFVGHGYRQYAESGRKGNHALQNHTYVIPGEANFKDAVAFEYGTSLGQEAWIPGNVGSKVEEGEEYEVKGCTISGEEAGKESGNETD